MSPFSYFTQCWLTSSSYVSSFLPWLGPEAVWGGASPPICCYFWEVSGKNKVVEVSLVHICSDFCFLLSSLDRPVCVFLSVFVCVCLRCPSDGIRQLHWSYVPGSREDFTKEVYHRKLHHHQREGQNRQLHHHARGYHRGGVRKHTICTHACTHLFVYVYFEALVRTL